MDQPDELSGWGNDLKTAAHSLANSIDLGPGIGVPGPRRR
ncbi:hypothetical protein SUDANB135_04863 [Streptomyces sp. SudanB135_2055]